MIARPSAISAMIRPQIRPFMASRKSLSIALGRPPRRTSANGRKRRPQSRDESMRRKGSSTAERHPPVRRTAKSRPLPITGFQRPFRRRSNWIMWRSMRSSSGESPSASPTSCGRCRTGMSSFSPMSCSISRWKPSSTVWQSGQGVTMVFAPLALADWMCCPVSLIAMRSSCGGGVESAALGTAAVVDRPAAENFRQLLERDVVARVDELVALRRARDVAAIECRDREAGERPPHQRAQPRLADILVQHPEEMADARAPAVVQLLPGEPRVDGRGKLGIIDEGRMRIEQVERAGVADRHQRQILAFGQRQNAHIERVEAERIDGAQLACAGAGRGIELEQIEAEAGGDPVGRLVELGAGRAGRASGIVGESHGCPLSLQDRAAAALAGVLPLQQCLDRIDLAAHAAAAARAAGRAARRGRAPAARARSDRHSRARRRPRAARCECLAISGAARRLWP